jgi:hypothetical protein
MPGVILFVIILIFYGFVLSTEVFRRLLGDDRNPQVKAFFDRSDGFFKSETSRMVMAIGGVMAGLWNFFAPDFGAGYSPTVIGALIPSVILILDSLVIYPGILGIFNIPQEQKEKVVAFMDRYEGMAGVITLAVALLHAFLFRIILL